MKINEIFQNKRIFFVHSETDLNALIAIHPNFDENGNNLRWWDTNHERLIELKEPPTIHDQELIFKSVQGNTYRFVPLNLALYRNVVKNQLPGRRDFNSEEEMIKAFEETMV